MNLKSTFTAFRRGLALSTLFAESSAFIALAEAATTSRTAEAKLRRHIQTADSQVQPGALDHEYVLAVRLEMLQLKKRGQELTTAINSLSQEEQALFNKSFVQERLSLLVAQLASFEFFPDLKSSTDNSKEDDDSKAEPDAPDSAAESSLETASQDSPEQANDKSEELS
jgi:hypothetical protein